jgi:hypothetical protein
MTICHKCGGQMTVKPSYFPGFDVLGCEPCDRPIKLLVRGPRPGSRQPRRADVNRMLRSARRMKARKLP